MSCKKADYPSITTLKRPQIGALVNCQSYKWANLDIQPSQASKLRAAPTNTWLYSHEWLQVRAAQMNPV